MQGIDTDLFIVSVNGCPFLSGQIHGGEAIDPIRESAPMTAIRALYHQVGGNDTALPGGRHGGGYLLPPLAIGARDSAWLHAMENRQLYARVIDGVLEVGERLLDVISGIQPQI